MFYEYILLIFVNTANISRMKTKIDIVVDNGSKKMVNLKYLKYISLLFYYCPDTCVSLVLLLA